MGNMQWKQGSSSFELGDFQQAKEARWSQPEACTGHEPCHISKTGMESAELSRGSLVCSTVFQVWG